MKSVFLSTLFWFGLTLCNAQTSEELNVKSKEFLRLRQFKDAISFIQKAAELGNAEAQYNYGVFFQQGIEVQKNDSVANSWFLKSASQGWVDAQFKVAYNFATGRGVRQDYSKAFQWSLRCAEQNDPSCMFNVVNCYLEGTGVEKNIDSMLIWATRLASLNTPENLQISGQITSARANLASMYHEGKYLQKSTFKSYVWFLIYNESKKDFSIVVQQQNINKIKALEKQLTNTQRESARKEAEALLKRNLTNLKNLYKQDL